MFNKCLIAASCLFAIMQLAGASTSEERFLEMPLDHFDQQNRETWNMVSAKNGISYRNKNLMNSLCRDIMLTT